jgi:hypothetical protein
MIRIDAHWLNNAAERAAVLEGDAPIQIGRPSALRRSAVLYDAWWHKRSALASSYGLRQPPMLFSVCREQRRRRGLAPSVVTLRTGQIVRSPSRLRRWSNPVKQRLLMRMTDPPFRAGVRERLDALDADPTAWDGRSD